jgi:hypothetical protein
VQGFSDVSIAALLAGGIAGLLAISNIAAAHAQQFSAELVHREAGGQAAVAAGKLNVSSGKVRIETLDLPTGFLIVRGDANAVYFVRPAQRIFMDAKQSSELTQVLVPVDPGDPCRQWQAMAKIAGAADQGAQWRCERVGHDTVDGRSTVKYQGTSPQNRRYFGWIDLRFRFPVKFEAEDGTTIEIVNIREAPQSENLFEIPAGYRKFDPQQLIDRIKQSDVWVEPMK